jgi:hypothetical protein
VYKSLKKTNHQSNQATFYDDTNKREKWPVLRKCDGFQEWKVSQEASKNCPCNKGAKKQGMPGPGSYSPIPKFKASDIRKDPAHANKEVPLGKLEYF